MTTMKLKKRDVQFHIKAVQSDGLFTGYGSVAGVVDSYREIVAPGAFAESLKAREKAGRKLPVLWQHNSAQPIGVYDKVQEDDTGLWLEGRLLVDDVALAKEALALMKAGAVTGLSIGYYVKADSYDEKERIRTLTAVDLQETSIVTFPANDEARIESVKAQLAAGHLPTLSEFEGILREAGFSKTQSAVIANRGLKHLLDRSESGGEPSDVLSALKAFVPPKFSI